MLHISISIDLKKKGTKKWGKRGEKEGGKIRTNRGPSKCFAF
jgi:hypothetical protein